MFHILVAEDNPADIRLIEEGFRDFSAPCELHSVRDGASAIEYLSQAGSHASAPLPDLVLLDLNMPGLNGYEVLEWMRSHRTLDGVPVVVLSSSVNQEDIDRAYRLRANSYMRKPADIDQFFDALDNVKSFWLKRVVVPA